MFLPTIFPAPPSWPAIFGRRAPVEVELGFGRPHFLLERARECPEHDIVGIEWKGRWPRTVWARQHRGEARNVRAVHGNAWLLFGAFFQPSSVRAIYLNFPIRGGSRSSASAASSATRLPVCSRVDSSPAA